MLLSKINSLAHLRAAPCNDLHATKLAPGECPHPTPSARVVVEGGTPGDPRVGRARLVSRALFPRQREGAPGVAVPGGPAIGQRWLRLGLLGHPRRRQLAGEWATPPRGGHAEGCYEQEGLMETWVFFFQVAIKHVEKDRISDWGELVSEPESETLAWVGGWRRACRNRRANPRPSPFAAQWHPSAHGSGPTEEGELRLLGRH